MVEVKLIKNMGHERIDCGCGMAVIPKDPSPELTERIRQAAREEGARFSLIDASLHPEIKHTLPCVMIEKNIYPADENIIRSAIRKEKHD